MGQGMPWRKGAMDQPKTGKIFLKINIGEKRVCTKAARAVLRVCVVGLNARIYAQVQVLYTQRGTMATAYSKSLWTP